MRSRFGKLAFCGLLATSALAAPAQSTVQPAYRTIDDNGVDLVQGDFRLNFQEGSIGSGATALPLVRVSNSNDFSQWDQLVFVQPVIGDIRIGMPDGSYELFSGTTSRKANGATLASDPGGYTYTAADGTKIRFVSGGTASAGTNFCDDPAFWPCYMSPRP